MKNRIYTTISIVGLIGIMCFIIYLVGNFIYFGVYEINKISNNNTNIDNVCIDTGDSQYNNSSRPVKGMKYKDSLDSLVFSNHTDLSSIDGDNFYSRNINDDLFYYGSNGVPRIDTYRDIKSRVNNYASYNNEVEVKLPTKITIKPSIIQSFYGNEVSYDITYNY